MGRGKNKYGNKGGRVVSRDEAKLWSHVTRDATPLPGSVDRIPDNEDFADLFGEPPRQFGGGGLAGSPALHPPYPVERASLLPKSPVGKSTLSRQTTQAGQPSLIGQTKQPAPAVFDKRNLRRISRGRIEIDARIDLHGMRQREAHSALRSFLFNAHAKGRRIVLVITGKGTAARSRDGDDWSMGHIEPGVLKRNVPYWLAEADLASIVVSHTHAGPRHGGDGALYIHLRRRLQAKPRT